MKYFCAIFLSILILSCSSSKNVENIEPNDELSETRISFIKEKEGVLYGAGEEGFSAGLELVKNQSELKAIIEKMQLDITEKLTPPKIFFDDFMYVFIFDKVRGASGYQLNVEKIFQKEKELFIRVISSSPSDNTQSVLIQPYLVLSMEKKDLSVNFNLIEK